MLDFILHFSCTFFIMLYVIFFYNNLKIAAIVASIISFLKELYDLYIQKEFISINDIVYDLLGIFLFILLYLLIKQKWQN